MPRCLPVLVLACAPFIATEPAYAHPPAEVWQVVSAAPDDVIVATSRGLIFGSLQTRNWTLLCSDGFGVGSSLPYGVAKLPGGRLLMAANDGLQGSDDRGCSWRRMPALAGVSTPALVQDRTAPERVYLATYALGRGGVQLSTDGGDSFTSLLSVSDDDQLGSLLLAPGHPAHLYAGLSNAPAGSAVRYFVEHSADGGESWERNEVTLSDSEVDLTLLAVNPAEPLQLVARATGQVPLDGERLLWSRDGGKSFSSPLTIRAMRAAAFGDDGKSLYVGGVDGLMRAQLVGDQAPSFTPTSSATRISALQQVDNELLASGYYRGNDVGINGVGAAAIDAGVATASFARWLDFDEVQMPADCPADSLVSQNCQTLFRDWLLENPPPLPGLDAGLPDAGAAADRVSDRGAPARPDASDDVNDAGSVAQHRPSSGCSVTSPALHDAWCVLLTLAACLARRARTPSARLRTRARNS